MTMMLWGDPGQGPTRVSSTHTTLRRLNRGKALARKRKETLCDNRNLDTRADTSQMAMVLFTHQQ